MLVEQDELDAAAAHFETARRLGPDASLPENHYRWYAAMAALRQARGDLDGAVELLEQAADRYLPGFFPDLRPLPAAIARVRIAQGRLAEAGEWVRRRGVTPDDPPAYAAEYDQLTLARYLLARAGGDELRAAVGLLDRIVEAAGTAGRAGSVIEARLLRGLARSAAGDAGAATADLTAAIDAGRAAGYVRLFLDAGPEAAALFRGTRPGGPSAPSGPAELSERELEVLRMLATDLSGPEIAGRLFVSVNTLRTHTKHLFTKLDVTSRRAAVRRAGELGLLQPRR
jgi:LuxR family maltose regulon positive regulatory protein